MATSDQYYVIGASGHAKVIVRMMQQSGMTVRAMVDDAPGKQHTTVCGVPVVGPCYSLLELPRYPTVIAIGNNASRKRIADDLNLDWATVIHPSVIIDDTVSLGPGSVVMAGAVIQVDSVLGAHCIVNTSASVDHDCVLGDYCHVAPGSHIAGHCDLGMGVFCGTGSVLIPSIRVGDWTTIGAGACVVRELPAGVTALGVPASISSQ